MTGGKFIVFEGLDRCGKTTMVQRLYERLSDTYPVKKIGFPNRCGSVGRVIDEYLRKEIKLEDETIHLLFSADRYEQRDMIEDCRRKFIILCDRYSMSGIVYSVSKGLDRNWCIMTECHLPKPDLTIFIDVPVEELSRRKGFGDEIHDDVLFQEKVRSLYHRLLKDEENVLIVDGTLPSDEIVEILVKTILE